MHNVLAFSERQAAEHTENQTVPDGNALWLTQCNNSPTKAFRHPCLSKTIADIPHGVWIKALTIYSNWDGRRLNQENAPARQGGKQQSAGAVRDPCDTCQSGTLTYP